MKPLITNLGLLQRINRFNQAHKPEGRIRRFRPGSANRQMYGQASLLDRGQVTTCGTLEAICRQAGILTEGEQTIDEATKALLLDLARAGSPRPDRKTAFDRWLKRHPEFAERVKLLEYAQEMADRGPVDIVCVSTGKEVRP